MDNRVNSDKADEESVQLTEQKLFYRDRIQALFWTVLGIGGITVLLACFMFVLLQKKISPTKIYFPASEQNQIIPEVPLDQPGIENNVLLTSVVESMNMAHTFNFMNYSRRMEKVKSYFTEEGYADYSQALTKIGLLELIVKNKLVILTMPLEVPQILKEGPFANRYLWKIKAPIQLNYRNVQTQSAQQFDLILLLMRVPTSESPLGVSIYKYEIQPRQQ